MGVIVDTSVIIAVITNEPHREKLLEITRGKELIAPRSILWEIGNAFSAMLKQKRITLEESLACIESYKKISIQLVDIDLKFALEISDKHNIYAYDAYLIACAHKYKSPLITLDKGLSFAAKNDNVTLLEVG